MSRNLSTKFFIIRYATGIIIYSQHQLSKCLALMRWNHPCERNSLSNIPANRQTAPHFLVQILKSGIVNPTES